MPSLVSPNVNVGEGAAFEKSRLSPCCHFARSWNCLLVWDQQNAILEAVFVVVVVVSVYSLLLPAKVK